MRARSYARAPSFIQRFWGGAIILADSERGALHLLWSIKICRFLRWFGSHVEYFQCALYLQAALSDSRRRTKFR